MTEAMRILGITGWSGSGKTTLLTALIPLLRARGRSVSTIKHAHHDVDLDQPGKDSWRHRTAGAQEVMIATSRRWALLQENIGREPNLATLLRRLAPVDLVLVEGFRASPHPKIEVHRPAQGQPPIWPGRADIVAVASDVALQHCTVPQLDLSRPDAVAGWILGFLWPAQPAA